jgi:2-oxo-4-hydroxy-4-carboxy-5-ureidoimidazoline decarboxylase
MALVLACAAVPRWAAEICDARPYADVEQALEAARQAASTWTEQEVDGALADHPRIGERATSQERSAEHSQAEQAGVDTSDDEITRRLAQGNRAYEERFGHVFLIRAAGRSASEILASLEQRLTHDPQTERRIAAEQLREIAVLRLQGELR